MHFQNPTMTIHMVLLQLLTFCSSPQSADDPFEMTSIAFERTDLGLIEYAAIDEASGIAASISNPGVLWVHNDSGDENRIYALNDKGEHLGVFFIDGVPNRDWEDIAIGPGPTDGQSYLYIGDIGDNDAEYTWKHIYRVPEPAVLPDQQPVKTTLSEVETITFQYADGSRDAETLMIDPLSKDLYVVSKRESRVSAYIAPYPQSTSAPMTLAKVATLPLRQVAAGDISADGDGVLVKTLDAIYYWQRQSGQSIENLFEDPPEIFPYQVEPQGEGICWHPVILGYYTVSEEAGNIPAHLYLYSEK